MITRIIGIILITAGFWYGSTLPELELPERCDDVGAGACEPSVDETGEGMLVPLLILGGATLVLKGSSTFKIFSGGRDQG